MSGESQTERIQETARDTMNSLQDTGEEMQDRMGEWWETGRERAIDFARKADRMIREKPYQSLGIALALGLITGMLMVRGGRRDEEED